MGFTECNFPRNEDQSLRWKLVLALKLHLNSIAASSYILLLIVPLAIISSSHAVMALIGLSPEPRAFF